MSLLTIERSGSSDNLSQLSGYETDDEPMDAGTEDIFSPRSRTSSFEGFFASKGAAYAIPDGDFARKPTLKGGELQSHLQGMVNLIRDEDTMRLVVKIESPVQANTRYLSIVTTYGATDEEESIVLGFDWINEEVTIGLVIPLWSNVSSELDGDGGFEIRTEHRNYIFKPVSVQTMWTALQWIHRCIATAHRANHFAGGLSHSWISYYENRITSPRECINFWECMDELISKRNICLSYFDKVKTDEELLKGSIRHKLKEILTRFDLEEVTCRQIREALEGEMKMSLQHLKGYVEEQLFSILGQMDSSSKITDTIFLGSEWNASNLEELKENGVGYILNVTKEIDNFFPGTFEYMNIRLHDVEESDLLRHWGKTCRFLQKAKEKGVTALVHCRRGISRSASTVVAYLMKEHDMSLHDAMKLVKSKRSIVQPNAGFWKQLIIYEGILKSSRNRHSSLFRRRSNSDSTNSKRVHKKPRHLKKDKSTDTDHTDGIPEHAHTLPRMASSSHEFTPECELALDQAQEDVTSTEQPADTSPLLAQATEEESCSEEASDGESNDEVSTSDSDEETSSTRSKLRRTHSEPVMKNVGEFSEISLVLRKPRARTVVERDTTSDEDTYGIVVTSPTRISQILQNEQSDILWMEAGRETKTDSEPEEVKQDSDINVETFCPETAGEPVNEHSVTSHNVAEETAPEEFSLVVPTGRMEASSESEMELASESSASDNVFTNPTETEGLSSVGDNKSAVLARDVPVTECGEEKTSVGVVAYENIPALESGQPRSRSIGEKLEDKLLHEQGKSESCENVKKVEGRGRAKLGGRGKSKSDLQLSNSGHVKRHTQIYEEQMLYTALQNSEKTLASSEVNFFQTISQLVDVSVPTPAERDSEGKSQNNSKNSENDSKNSENDSKNSENDSKNSENDSKNSENDSKNSENNWKNVENDSKNSENDSKNSEMESKNSEIDSKNSEIDSKNSEIDSKNSGIDSKNSEIDSKNSGIDSKNSEIDSKKSEIDSKNSEIDSKNSKIDSKNSENIVKNSEKLENEKDMRSASDELQNIVQKVNEEVKRDIEGQVDVSRLPLVSQKESTDHAHDNDEVCIDQMAWIDLTHHHGDIVKRKSAVFENVTEERSRSQAKTESSYRNNKQSVGTGSNESRSPVRASGEMDSNEYFGSSVENEMREFSGEVAQRESCGARLSNEVPRLELLQLSNEGLSETSYSTNSIIVEDYRNWECSSVRERTQILENIIAKTGGSFPSPRSKGVEKEKENGLAVDENADEEVKTILLFSDESVPVQEEFKYETRRRSSSCPVGKTLTGESVNDNEFLGDEMFRILVNKFEKKNGETETSGNLQTV